MKIYHLVVLTIITLTLTTSNTVKDIPKFTFVQVNPSALDVMIHAFDQVLIYFHNYESSLELENVLKAYEEKINKTKQLYANDHTLFGYINKTQDFKGLLSRFGDQNGFKLINTVHIFHYDQSEDLVSFYSKKVHPKIPLMYKDTFTQLSTKSQGFHLLFEYQRSQQLYFFNSIFEKINNFLPEFNTLCYASPSLNKSISLYKDGKIFTSYNLYNRTEREAAQELIQLINIDTLPTIIDLDEGNFHRVFGGSIQDQLLMIYQKDALPQLQQVQQEFKKAAHKNRFQSLSYQRVLFNLLDTEFFDNHFNQNIQEILNKDNKKFVIYFTKTDYDKFQLKRYKFQPSKQVNTQSILQFIEDVRSKRLDPQYKSQATPSQQQQNKHILRKIVGNTFISQVYEKPQQSIIILFIDSKDQTSYKKIKQLLQQFTIKYKSQIENKLITAIFDLDRNQHKLLYLKQAPQLIVFDKSNKKQTKYIKVEQTLSLEALTREIKKVVTNVDWSINTQL